MTADIKVSVGEVTTRTNKNDRVVAEALIGVAGPLPIGYSKLAKLRNPDDDDKYVVVFNLTEEQRKTLIEKLTPAGVELATAKGIKTTPAKVEAILRGKIKEIEGGMFRLGLEQKMIFRNPDGDHLVDLAVLGPDGQPMEKPYLTDGSTGKANFIMEAVANRDTGALQLPFRLVAVKIDHAVLYEKQERPRHDDFSALESDY